MADGLTLHATASLLQRCQLNFWQRNRMGDAGLVHWPPPGGTAVISKQGKSMQCNAMLTATTEAAPAPWQ